MKLFARHSVRRYVFVSALSVVCTLAVVGNWRTEYVVEQSIVDMQQQQPNAAPPRPLPTTSAEVVTKRARDWRRTNRVVLEYNTDVAQRLKKLAEHRTLSSHPDTVRLARDLLDPPPDNPDGIKHARYVMKTPQAAKVDEITHNMVYNSLLFVFHWLFLQLTARDVMEFESKLNLFHFS